MTIKERLFIMPIKTYRINKIIIAEEKPTMSLLDLSVKVIWISDYALNVYLYNIQIRIMILKHLFILIKTLENNYISLCIPNVLNSFPIQCTFFNMPQVYAIFEARYLLQVPNGMQNNCKIENKARPTSSFYLQKSSMNTFGLNYKLNGFYKQMKIDKFDFNFNI